MSEFRRRLMMQAESDLMVLPAGCVRCEYLESNGGQWIDTDFYPISGDEFYIDRVKVAESDSTLFGAGTDVVQLAAVHNNSLWVRYFNVSGVNVGNPKLSEYSLLVTKNGNIYVDGVGAGVSPPSFTNPNTTLAIFNRGTRTASFHGYIGTITITRDSEYVVNLVPCLDTDGIPCYYDTVNKKFHYNKGTGQFLYKILEQ